MANAPGPENPWADLTRAVRELGRVLAQELRLEARLRPPLRRLTALLERRGR